VPNTTGNPYHCPSAATLADVSTSCTDVDLSPSYMTVTIGEIVYFKMSNQGGGNQGGGGGGGGSVPEFSDYAMFAIMATAGLGFFAMRRKSSI
jgi:hypothetical protein